jgi:hypothetical protein
MLFLELLGVTTFPGCKKSITLFVGSTSPIILKIQIQLMTFAGPKSRYLSDLPCREQLARIRQLETHLKAFLGRYDFEPRTLDHFLRRETLLEQMRSLETKLYQVSEQLNRKKGTPVGMASELAALNREFRELETRVHAYTGS